ncbi:MAG: HAD hydrolase-like protein [Sulfurovum sp.]
MIKSILWDFDGVVFDSMKIKADGFMELFSEYDEVSLKLLKKYHYNNGGVSRFEKIRYFYERIIKENIDESQILTLADKFAKIIESKLYNKSNLIVETVEFIKQNYQKYNFHIVSGAEHRELNNLCDTFELTQYFISIDGSPTQKDTLVKNVIEKYNYKKEETILIGDAMTDYNASMNNAINFYGYNNSDLKKFDNYIDSFKEFKL